MTVDHLLHHGDGMWWSGIQEVQIILLVLPPPPLPPVVVVVVVVVVVPLLLLRRPLASSPIGWCGAVGGR